MNQSQHIEVEKKVNLETHHLEKIENEGIFIKELKFKDVYFDRANCSLTSQNIWLRQREKEFELKIGIKGSNGFSDRYEEVKNEQKILSYLGLTPHCPEPLEDTLSRSGITSFASFLTQRKRYQIEELFVDIDIATFEDLTYRVAEFEIIVPSTEHMVAAEDKIKKMLDKFKIDPSVSVPAKLTYYLYHRRPHHYNILIDNHVIQPIDAPSLK